MGGERKAKMERRRNVKRSLERLKQRRAQPKYRPDGSLITKSVKDHREELIRKVLIIVNGVMVRRYLEGRETAEEEAIRTKKEPPKENIVKPKKPRVLNYEGEQSHDPKFYQGGLPSLGKKR